MMSLKVHSVHKRKFSNDYSTFEELIWAISVYKQGWLLAFDDLTCTLCRKITK